jgi:predicted O-methyltransferase YrrM
LLERLYAQNAAQDDALAAYFTARAAEGSLDWNQFDARTNEFLKDKLVALDRAKAEFCYHVCRALRAQRVEALSLIAPHLREGAVVICDNTLQFREAYGEYFDFVQDPHNRLRTMTLPFEGGLEFTVRAR